MSPFSVYCKATLQQHSSITTDMIRTMIRFKIYPLILLCTLLTGHATAYAKGTYQAPDEFVAQAFNNTTPDPELIWIKGELRQQIESILQHKYKGKRIRYWRQQQRSVWVLEEIGKKKPITVGIVIEANKIARLKVLVFRETRGWEVRYPFFTQQFQSLFLQDDHTLSNHIDGISGATLSVRALDKLARIALLLNQETQQNESS